MRSLDRSVFDVHVACPAAAAAARTPAYTMLANIPDLHVVPSNFGPSMSGRSGVDKLLQLFSTPAMIGGFYSLSRYIRRHRIALVHATDRPRDAVASAVLGRLTGAKSIVHAHLKCADWMSSSIHWSMRRVDAIIGISRFVAQSLVDYGYSRDKVYAVLNAIDLPVWDYSTNPNDVRKEFGIPHAAPVIACAARLFRGKGQDSLIRALPGVRNEFPGVRLLIIGRDDRQAMRTSFTEELKTLARDLGVAEHVIFTGHRADMPALIAASDVFAMASDEEPFGLVFAEAMAMKKPVVALANGGTPEVVDHGKSGLLSAPGDQESLAANLRVLLRDPELRARMGEYGRSQVEARFTAARMAADIGLVYESLLSSRRGQYATAAASH